LLLFFCFDKFANKDFLFCQRLIVEPLPPGVDPCVQPTKKRVSEEVQTSTANKNENQNYLDL